MATLNPNLRMPERVIESEGEYPESVRSEGCFWAAVQ